MQNFVPKRSIAVAMKDTDQKFATLYYATQMRSAMYDVATEHTLKSCNYYDKNLHCIAVATLDSTIRIMDAYIIRAVCDHHDYKSSHIKETIIFMTSTNIFSLILIIYANKFCNLEC